MHQWKTWTYLGESQGDEVPRQTLIVHHKLHINRLKNFLTYLKLCINANLVQDSRSREERVLIKERRGIKLVNGSIDIKFCRKQDIYELEGRNSRSTMMYSYGSII